MPLQQAIWRIDQGLKKLPTAAIAKEIELEVLIEQDISVLSAGWLIIGRQVMSDVGPIDLLALDRSGSLIVIEIKKDQTTRDVTAQALDYAAWIEHLTTDEIAGIYIKYCEKYQPKDIDMTLDQVYKRRFGTDLPIEDLNSSHQIVIIAAELDARTERIIRYLFSRGIEINVLFFQVFADDTHLFLSRVWMLDQIEIQEQKSHTRLQSRSAWNGEYYVSFGVDESFHRIWEEAMKYGFISAGGGRWYSNTLQLLEPGARVWVNVPGIGYVGVGEVTGNAQRAPNFRVLDDSGESTEVLNVLSGKASLEPTADDPDLAEYYVPIRWIKTVPLRSAFKEVGFFGNQNTVCQPVTPKWTHTVGRLKQLWNVL